VCKKTRIFKLCRVRDRLCALAHAKIARYTSVATPGLGGSFSAPIRLYAMRKGNAAAFDGKRTVGVRSDELGRSDRAGHDSEDGMD
jgi:hypothetical protein